MKKIILASASPQRRDLLEKLGITFSVEPSDYIEDLTLTMEPCDLAQYLSFEKAKRIASKHSNAVVIAADTFGVFEGAIIGKSYTESEARRTLELLQGNCHAVVTGFTILDTENEKMATGTVETQVYFRKLTSREIAAYVATGEPLNRAAAYAIQGLGGIIVDRYEGDYYNVVGLPLRALTDALKEFDISVFETAVQDAYDTIPFRR